MSAPAPTKADLDRELADLRRRFPRLKDHELFVLWFLRAYVTDSEDLAAEALSGASREKGIDALLIDDAADLITIVQGKLRDRVMGTPEKLADVVEFGRLAQVLGSPEREFQEFRKDLEPLASRRARAARRRLLEKNYRLNLHYVTLGRCSASVLNEGRSAARAARPLLGHTPQLRVFDGRQTLAVLVDYLDGVAPPVPSLELQAAGEVAYQHEKDSKIESWVFSMNGAAVGKVLDQVGDKLFARNIRGYLGDTKINKGIRSTLDRHPGAFWYLNNGITLICDAAAPDRAGGAQTLEVFNPQIINGQQTTYVLRDAGATARKARVFLRVISVPREAARVEWADYERMVGQVVEATNSQNRISPADLRSNDRVQVSLQRELRKLNYHYVRKKGLSLDGELAAQHRWKVRKEDVARAAMTCQSAATVLNEGVQALFEEPTYSQLFSLKPKQLLIRWRLMKAIDGVARGKGGERQWAKHLVVQFMWDDLGGEIEQREDSFLEACELGRGDLRFGELERAIGHAMKAAVQHFRLHRGKGADRLEVSPFFKRRDQYAEFERSWRSGRLSHRANYRKAARAFVRELKVAA